MYRFVAFSWNSKDSTKTAAAQRHTNLLLSTSPEWQCVLNTHGLRVFHAPQPAGACHAYVLDQDAGVVLGKLFDSSIEDDHLLPDPNFGPKESALLIESQGRHLVERYWGHYVAFLRTPENTQRFVVRDPTGGLPCFMTMAEGIDVFLSDMEDCVRLNLAPFSIDWNHLSAFFLHSRLVTRTTGFKEVTQIYAGECVAIDDHDTINRMTRSFYWNPVDVYEANTIENSGEARAKLETSVRHCANAWASCYPSIVHQLSGGLDSSIIAACLAKRNGDQDILCFHFFTEMAEGDERAYARAAAKKGGYELIESEVRVGERTLQELLDKSRLASPSLVGLNPEYALLKQRLVTERRAGAIFSGQGGDHLFQETRTELVAAEFAHRHGFRPRLLRVARDTSTLTHRSIWSTLSAAVRYGVLRKHFDPYSFCKAPSILNEEARTSLPPGAYRHPWMEHTDQLPASKIQHIYNIIDCQPFYSTPCTYAEQIHPLISQPIIERSLQIPCYVLTRRGRARGLVREAFEADVPAKIIDRRSKGATTNYFNRLLVENAAFLRETLLDGVLVNEHVLNRREVEKQLSERELIVGNGRRSILCAVAAEAWLSTWSDMTQRSAA